MQDRPYFAYFERLLPIGLVVGSFFGLFVPLALLLLRPNFIEWLPYVLLLESVGLGTSHFFITLAVYLQAENRAYFASGVRNRLTYIAAPAGILLLFSLSEVLGLPAKYPLFASYFFRGVRFFDFFHVGRQSVGMLQILKRPLAADGSAPARQLENAFFVGMALLQWQTFLSGGRFETQSAYATVPALALAALFFAIVLGYLKRITRRANATRSSLPLCYFAMQAVCAATAAYQTRLYLVALAMHYAEYHVIMAPRCFYAARDLAPSSESLATRLRQRPLLFYAVLLLIVILFEMRSQVSHDIPATTAFFVHLFDGIFFVHYFIEAFLWKLGNPFYRQTLAPLYFEPWPPSKQTRHRPIWRFPAAGAWAATFAAIVLGAFSQDRIGAAAHAFTRRVIDPMHAEHHVRWGVELARAGDLEAARRHFREAVHRNPDDDQAQSALHWIDGKLGANTGQPP